MLSVQEKIKTLASVTRDIRWLHNKSLRWEIEIIKEEKQTKYIYTLRHFPSISLDSNIMLSPWCDKWRAHILGVLSGRCQGFYGMYTAKYLIHIYRQLQGHPWRASLNRCNNIQNTELWLFLVYTSYERGRYRETSWGSPDIHKLSSCHHMILVKPRVVIIKT